LVTVRTILYSLSPLLTEAFRSVSEGKDSSAKRRKSSTEESLRFKP
jgi:hypothetical protein